MKQFRTIGSPALHSPAIDLGRHSMRLFQFLFVFLVLGSAPVIWGQTTQGFTGVVKDTSGAVIPHAQVTIHNENTGVDKRAVTTSTGVYTVPFLAPGVYDVMVEMPGFQKVNKVGITLQVDQTATVNLELPIGTIDTTVTVNSSSDVLEYSKADRGMVLDNKSIQELPVLDGNTF